jgi:hypothetical protein
MKKLLTISILGVLCYYGVKYYNYMNSGVTYINPNLKAMVDEWKSKMKEHGLQYEDAYIRLRRIEIVDESLIDNLAGQSNKWTGTIRISNTQIIKGYWTTKAILWHELGHYIFDLDHVDDVTIMNSNTFDEYSYRNYWHDFELSYINQIKDGI